MCIACSNKSIRKYYEAITDNFLDYKKLIVKNKLCTNTFCYRYNLNIENKPINIVICINICQKKKYIVLIGT